VRPRHRYNEALSFIEQGLDDISISRATLKWGISVPWDESQVIYVWVDALINYLSALSYARGPDLFQRFWPATYHLMAQDILKFHGIIWPALLMSAGYELPEHLFIHGYLKLGGEKMSKTRGNVMDPFPLIEEYGADSFRFYCLREVSFGQDGMVSEEGFKTRYNAELANELGNLLSRTTSMIDKYRCGLVPAPTAGYVSTLGSVGTVGGRGTVVGAVVAAESESLALIADGTCARALMQLDALDLSGALETIWGFVRRLNRYVEERAPWKLAKEAAEAAPGLGDGCAAAALARPGASGGAGSEARIMLDTTLWELAEGLRLLSVLLYPFIPHTALAIRERLGLDTAATAAAPSWDEAHWGLLPAGLKVTSGSALFPRIEE
jgi:methionyl-tRNA synthetase